jgi:hypothetical protein
MGNRNEDTEIGEAACFLYITPAYDQPLPLKIYIQDCLVDNLYLIFIDNRSE